MVTLRDSPPADVKRPLHRATQRLPGPARLAELRLRSSSYQALSAIACQYHDGILILQGHVPCYYLKQVAQELVASLGGVHRIDNRLVVQSEVWGNGNQY